MLRLTPSEYGKTDNEMQKHSRQASEPPTEKSILSTVNQRHSELVLGHPIIGASLHGNTFPLKKRRDALLTTTAEKNSINDIT